MRDHWSRAAPTVPIRRRCTFRDLVVAGDVVYNQYMYVGDTTESRKNWTAALDRLAALKPAMVVAGHKNLGRARLTVGDRGHEELSSLTLIG